MKKALENIKNYGIAEYLITIVGVIFLYKVSEYVIIHSIKDMEYDEIAILFFILCIGSICVSKPLTIVSIAKKRIGSNNKLNK